MPSKLLFLWYNHPKRLMWSQTPPRPRPPALPYSEAWGEPWLCLYHDRYGQLRILHCLACSSIPASGLYVRLWSVIKGDCFAYPQNILCSCPYISNSVSGAHLWPCACMVCVCPYACTHTRTARLWRLFWFFCGEHSFDFLGSWATQEPKK